MATNDAPLPLLFDISMRAADLGDHLDRLAVLAAGSATLGVGQASCDPRVSRALAAAANRGAGLGELASAVGLTRDDVLTLLRLRPELLDPGVESRLFSSSPVGSRPGAEGGVPSLSRVRLGVDRARASVRALLSRGHCGNAP